MSGPGRRSLAIGACLVAGVAGLAMVGGMVAAQVREEVRDTAYSGSSGTALLQTELEAMLDAGLPADDPKVQMLQDEIAALEALEGAEPVPEPVPLPGIEPADAAGEGGQRHTAVDSSEQWDVGEVECEPVPGHLTADDVRNATCRVEPQNDGSSHYIVTFSDGTEQTVPFGDGTPQATPATPAP